MISLQISQTATTVAITNGIFMSNPIYCPAYNHPIHEPSYTDQDPHSDFFTNASNPLVACHMFLTILRCNYSGYIISKIQCYESKHRYCQYSKIGKCCTHYSDKYCFKSFQLHLPHSLFSGFSFNHFSVTFFQSFGTCSSVISPDLIFNP